MVPKLQVPGRHVGKCNVHVVQERLTESSVFQV